MGGFRASFFGGCATDEAGADTTAFHPQNLQVIAS